MPKSARKIDYLFHKNGSPSWYVRFQRGGKDVIESLRTTDRLEAEANAATRIGEPKGGPAFQISRLDWRLGVPSTGNMIEIAEDTRPDLPRKRADDAILETYIRQANLTGYPEREARAMWSLFRTLTN